MKRLLATLLALCLLAVPFLALAQAAAEEENVYTITPEYKGRKVRVGEGGQTCLVPEQWLIFREEAALSTYMEPTSQEVISVSVVDSALADQVTMYDAMVLTGAQASSEVYTVNDVIWHVYTNTEGLQKVAFAALDETHSVCVMFVALEENLATFTLNVEFLSSFSLSPSAA